MAVIYSSSDQVYDSRDKKTQQAWTRKTQNYQNISTSFSVSCWIYYNQIRVDCGRQTETVTEWTRKLSLCKFCKRQKLEFSWFTVGFCCSVWKTTYLMSILGWDSLVCILCKFSRYFLQNSAEMFLTYCEQSVLFLLSLFIMWVHFLKCLKLQFWPHPAKGSFKLDKQVLLFFLNRIILPFKVLLYNCFYSWSWSC